MFKFLMDRDPSPFSVGSIIVNNEGGQTAVVNKIYKVGDEWRMLIDRDFCWYRETDIARFCSESVCSQWHGTK